MKQLVGFIHHGWLKSKKKVPSELKQFWDKRDVILEAEGLLFVKNRIIAPRDLRKGLDLLHLGIEQSKNEQNK